MSVGWEQNGFGNEDVVFWMMDHLRDEECVFDDDSLSWQCFRLKLTYLSAMSCYLRFLILKDVTQEICN